MVYALILSGGKGIRLGGDIPKQYIEVGNKPVIGYSLDTFQNNSKIDGIVIVADTSWQDYQSKYIEDNGVDDDAIVIVHDAARPGVTDGIIEGCIDNLENYDCAMPVLPVKDTVYLSKDHKTIASLLKRDELVAGQAPESVRLGQYYGIISSKTDEELMSISGTSAVIYESGLKVGLFEGSEKNYKITTTADLEKFRREIEG